MKVRTKSIAIALTILIVIVLGTGSGCTRGQTQRYRGVIEKITVAAGKTAVLVYIALDQGYFADHGLEVTINSFQAGKLATGAMLAGEADISTASSSVLVSHSFERDDLRTFAGIATYQIRELIARKDRGIGQIADLEGKRIGVTRNTGAEAALGRFLTLNGLSFQAVEIVDLKPQEIEDAMVRGEIDAALAWEPHVYNVKQALGDTVISWPGDSDQDSTFMLITTADWLTDHPSVAERFLMALLQAEQHVKENDDEAKTFVQQQFDYEPGYLQSVWPKYSYSVRLPQALILDMEDEARWRIENKLTDKTTVPNYLDFIYTDALEAVNPEAVTVIR